MQLLTLLAKASLPKRLQIQSPPFISVSLKKAKIQALKGILNFTLSNVGAEGVGQFISFQITSEF